MANKKVKFLSKEDRAFLLDVERYNPGIVAGIEKSGSLPDWFIDAAQRGKAQYGSDTDRKVIKETELSKLNTLISQLSKPAIYKNFIESTADESGLTANELRDRLEAYQETQSQFGGLLTKTRPDKNRLEVAVHNIMTEEGWSGRVADQKTPEFVKLLMSSPDPTENLKKSLGAENSKGEKVYDSVDKRLIALGGQVRDNQFSTYDVSDASPDISRLKEAIATATTKEEKDAAIESYLSGLPGELKSSRESFLSGEEDRAFSALERQVPLVLQNLNVRGMLQSGEREDELTTRALSLGSSLEEIQAELEADDNQFYFDAAFQNALRKELSSVEDYRSAIGGARRNILTERENRFQSSQSELDRQLQEDLTTSSYARDIALQRKKLQRERQQQQDANRLGIVSKIGETAANIGTNVVLDKVG